MNMETSYSAVNEQMFVESVKVGLVSSSAPVTSEFAPSIISNNSEERTDVLSVLKKQLSECERFDFSVAFITASGIEAIVQILLALRDANIPGRILTTTFNNFNEPEALRKLLEFPNIDVRVYEGNLHTKGYCFKKGDLNAILIGSANLTQAALCMNREWNVLLHSYSEGELFHSVRREYESLWEDDRTVPLNEEWLASYEEYRSRNTEAKASVRPLKAFTSKHYRSKDRVSGKAERLPSYSYHGSALPKADSDEGRNEEIVPNGMQEKALASLKVLHGKGEPRALLISATGTGKTYLSAFDVKAVNPRRVLFIAHRHRILEASRKSYRKVLGDSYSYGIYPDDGSTADCVFAMVKSLKNHLDEFDPQEFDYIVIDEAHHGGAQTYRDVLDFFKPSFLLGMTATPERTDGFDICDFYNHTIAYRITLQDALGAEMLAPFHYYGISDLAIDDETQDDVSLFRKLTSPERVRHIIKAIEDYSVNKKERRCLVFCSRNNEARRLAELFCEQGYKAMALSGEDPESVRNAAINKLEKGDVEFIFSVDILNEGIDIPSVNEIVMLRPTESAIVFVQQLGRGLRKNPHKESVLVLDFIGNYQSNYLIPVALSGDRTYNKDNLRRFVKEGSTVIPGCSTISFDRIAEAKIFEMLDAVKFTDTRLIKQEYLNLSNMLGRIPTLADFVEQEAIDPVLIFEKFGSYHDFLKKYEERYTVSFDPSQEQMLRYVSKKLAKGHRVEDLLVLKRLILDGSISRFEFDDFVCGAGCERDASRLFDSVATCLKNEFILKDQRSKFESAVFIAGSNDGFVASDLFRNALENEQFKKAILETIEFGLSRHERMFPEMYEGTGLCLYQKYSFEEAFRLLGWSHDVNKQNVGGYMYDADTNTFPIFVNYKKDDEISDSIKYEDRFLSQDEFVAISKQPRKMTSPEIVRLKEHDRNGMKAYLFVRKHKDDGDGKEFYFLGRVRPTQEYEPIDIAGKPAVEIGYKFDHPVRQDIYDYLLSSID